MWFDEVERIGKRRCTPLGYALQVVGDLIGFVGLLMLVAVPAYLVYRGVTGSFHGSLLWLALLPVAVGVGGSTVVGVSWQLAARKGFRYDYERRESTWVEAGEVRSFTYDDLRAADRRVG